MIFGEKRLAITITSILLSSSNTYANESFVIKSNALIGQVSTQKIISEKKQENAREPIKSKSDTKISSDLISLIHQDKHSPKKIKVVVGLTDDQEALIEDGSTGSVIIDAGGNTDFRINNKKVLREAITDITEKNYRKNHEKQKKINTKRNKKLKQLSKRHSFLPEASLSIDSNDNQNYRILSLTPLEILELEKNSGDLIIGIEKYIESENNIQSAMIVSGVTGNTSNGGAGIKIYMTEAGCPLPGFQSTTYLGGGNTDKAHAQNVSGIMSSVAPSSQIFCRGGAVLPTQGDMSNQFDIINRSNSFASNGDYDIRARDWDNFAYNNNIPIFVSAGNNGNNAYVNSPALGINVIAVGNHTDSKAIASDSSGKNPKIGIDKPEISAPGTNIDAGDILNYSGTSMASPHAVGMVANLLSNNPWMKGQPHLIKAMTLAAATLKITGNQDAVGLGGLWLNDLLYNSSMWWATGNSTSFDAWKGASGNLEYNFTVANTNSKVTVSLAWLESGTWTYNHRNDIHPVGTDYDLFLYDPNGVLVGASEASDNLHEIITFTPAMVGTYQAHIKRYANNDVNGGIKIAIVAHTH